MNKPTKYRKINKAEYKALIPAMQAYRKEFKAFIRTICPDFKYIQVFTETRAYGIRTKFWCIRVNDERGLVPVSNYIAQHPTIVVNGIEYEVNMNWIQGRYRFNRISLGLNFKALSVTN